MKKIGIITFHKAHNYGAVLQAYALQKVLSQNHNVSIINYRNEQIEDSYKVVRIKKENIISLAKSLISSFIYYSKNKKRHINFDEFIKEYMNLTDEYKSEQELKDNPPDLDIYITGSDQVWNYNISGKKIDAYTLNFGNKNIKKISYAASIGTLTFDEINKEKYVENINKIHKISVREEKAQEYLKDVFDNNVEVTLDPTLLVKKEDWEKQFDLENTEKQKYIFVYTLTKDAKYYEIINWLSKKTGLKVIHLGKRNEKIKNILRNAYSDGPVEFLKLIKNAEYVITSSFHATVFSLIFNKKFWSIPPKKTGSRITNLLEKLRISNRIVYTLEEFKNKKYDEKIDYIEVDKKLEKERKKSIDWLNDAINS